VLWPNEICKSAVVGEGHVRPRVPVDQTSY
jgi:hypothetical protein